jgi:hypothetical protein
LILKSCRSFVKIKRGKIRDSLLYCIRLDFINTYVSVERRETFCSFRLDLVDAYVGIGIGEILCSKLCRLDLVDVLSELEKEIPLL